MFLLLWAISSLLFINRNKVGLGSSLNGVTIYSDIIIIVRPTFQAITVVQYIYI